jgi:hypothetical protein
MRAVKTEIKSKIMPKQLGPRSAVIWQALACTAVRAGGMDVALKLEAGSEWRDVVINAGPIGEIARMLNLELAKGNVRDVRYCYRCSPCYSSLILR